MWAIHVFAEGSIAHDNYLVRAMARAGHLKRSAYHFASSIMVSVLVKSGLKDAKVTLS